MWSIEKVLESHRRIFHSLWDLNLLLFNPICYHVL